MQLSNYKQFSLNTNFWPEFQNANDIQQYTPKIYLTTMSQISD